MRRAPSLCERAGGMCCGDSRCPDRNCPSLPMEDTPPYTVDSVEYGIWAVIVASLVVIVVGVASALGRYWPAPY